MCAIVAFKNQTEAFTSLKEGLNYLSYRGYDSFGFVYEKNQQFLIEKHLGAFESKKIPFIESSFILGHSRWATHGPVSLDNTHPFQNEFFSVVHNGIIENVQELCEEFNIFFSPETTDTLLFLNILTKLYKENSNILSCLKILYEKIKGKNVFVFIHHESKILYGLKKGLSLVCSAKSLSLASDPLGLKDDEIFLLPENIIFSLDQEFHFFHKDLIPLQLTKTFFPQKKKKISKGIFDHFMIKEIYDQAESLNTFTEHFNHILFEELLSECIQEKQLYITGCGSSYHAALFIKELLLKTQKFSVDVFIGGELRSSPYLVKKKAPLLIISQSGETADLLPILEEFPTYSIYSLVNQAHSYLALNTKSLLLHAGEEVAVASTKVFTHQIYSFIFGLHLDPEKKASKTIQKALMHHHAIKKLAQKYSHLEKFFFLGRSLSYSLALEGALKLKEVSYYPCEGYYSSEFKHGPLALIDERSLTFILNTKNFTQKNEIAAREILSRHSFVEIFHAHEENEYLDSLFLNVLTQLFSYEFSLLKKRPIDRPRNLAKSITVE